MASPANAELDAALLQLFKAYDIDESGELSREEFLKIEMRRCIDKGEVFKEDRCAEMTLADKDRSGQLSFEEFRERQKRNFSEDNLSPAAAVKEVQDLIKSVLTERVKMGPRFHAGIRQAIKRIFNLYDTSGDGSLSPQEWIAAQKVVALEIMDDIDEAWVDEASFSKMDTNNDGAIQLSEFMEASFAMFEGVKQRSDAIFSTLQRVIAALEKMRVADQKETEPIMIYTQSGEKPEFQPPRLAWQDEPTEDDMDRNASAWKACGELAFPLHLQSVEEVARVLRLFLGIASDFWISIFFIGPGDKDSLNVTLLRGERPGNGNVQATLEWMAKPKADRRMYVKNVRQRPQRLSRQQNVFFDEREELLKKRTGQCWGLDWETQIGGLGQKLPQSPVVVMVGDALVIEVPQTDEGQQYRYVSSVFMDRTDVLSRPVDQEIDPASKKKKKKKAQAADAAGDPPLQYTFVALQPGRSRVFVDVSWEDQEEKLAATHRLTAPVAENSIARIGPVEVEVQRPQASFSRGKAEAEKPGFQWWNGEKWSNKKGPAKAKHKKGR